MALNKKNTYLDYTIQSKPRFKSGVAVIDKAVEKGAQPRNTKRYRKYNQPSVASPAGQKEALKARQRKLADAGYYKGKIDGIWGKQSKAAQAAYDKANGKHSETVLDAISRNTQNILNQAKEIETKENSKTYKAGLFSFLGNFLNSKLPDSEAEGLQAIMDHKTKYHINDPYMFVDKNTGMYYIINNGNNILKQGKVTLGENKGDGWYDYYNDPATKDMRGKKGQFYWTMPNTTPAGVFTADPVETSKYQGNAPMFFLEQSGVRIPVAFHSPADNSRRRNAYLNGNNNASNRVSFGCISGKCEDLEDIYNEQLITKGDTVYINPEIKGNKLIERDAKMQMEWGGNNPETFTTPGGWKGKFTYNRSK